MPEDIVFPRYYNRDIEEPLLLASEGASFLSVPDFSSPRYRPQTWSVAAWDLVPRGLRQSEAEYLV